MNKYIEAFNRVFNEDTYCPNDESYIKDGVIYKKDEELIKQLIDKETPMKVKDKIFIDTHRKFIIGKCPNPECKGKNIYKDYHLWEYMNFCPVCGQKLYWGEDDE